ncbi:MAG: hypothetical protein ACLFUU_11550 [Desulfobacteraceae bacterium]
MLIPWAEDRIKMIKAALQTKAPKTYRELEKSGELKEFLEEQDNQMMDCFYTAENQALAPIIGRDYTDYLAYMREINMTRWRVWHQVLEAYLEFADPEDEDEVIF